MGSMARDNGIHTDSKGVIAISALKYWLWLSSLRGLGNQARLRILDHFGTPENAYYADRAEYGLVDGLSKTSENSLMDKSLDAVDIILGECERLGQRIITMQDAEYPERLKNIYDPPIVLYVKGKMFAFDEEVAIAMVGTRDCTPYGLITAERLARQMAKCGALIVSGMAIGADTAAHKGALLAGASTVAVLGCGIDINYPKENKFLQQDIAATGALISEYPPGTQVARANFPTRNRIISGLCLGTVVVEAPQRSGALITAATALEQGRDVFAVPGNVDAQKSTGTNNLIKEGAILVTCGWDVLREYAALYPYKITENYMENYAPVGYQGRQLRENAIPQKVASPVVGMKADDKKEIDNQSGKDYIDLQTQNDFSEDQKKIVAALIEKPLHIDDIIDKTQISAPRVLSAMTMLEIKGMVKQHKGKRFELMVHIKC